MQNPNTDKFHQLIRRNRGNSGHKTCSLVKNGNEIFSPEKQRKTFAEYYEDLSVPKDNGYDSAYLELCNVRHELIKQVCEETFEVVSRAGPRDVVAGGGTESQSLEPSGESREGEGEHERGLKPPLIRIFFLNLCI